jgi:serine/threonine protein kinase
MFCNARFGYASDSRWSVRDYHNHLAKHLQEVALAVLPSALTGDEEVEADSDSAKSVLSDNPDGIHDDERRAKGTFVSRETMQVEAAAQTGTDSTSGWAEETVKGDTNPNSVESELSALNLTWNNVTLEFELSLQQFTGRKWVSLLQRELCKARVRSSSDGRVFIPVSDLRRIINTVLVQEELDEHNSKRYGDVIHRLTWHGAFESRKRILAVLALLGRADAIFDFIFEEIHDEHLPFDISEISIANEKLVASGTESSQHRTPAACFQQSGRLWTTRLLKAFDMYQWAMLAPVFEKPGSDQKVSFGRFYPLPNRIILPFVEGGQLKSTSAHHGGYGTVTKVKIHEAHHHFGMGGENTSYAIKRLHSQDKNAFYHEVKMLQYFNMTGHEHIIKPLGAFEYRDQYHLLSLWADSNLRAYWKRHPQPLAESNSDWLLWMAEQSHGLASGLQHMHDPGVNLLGEPAAGLRDPQRIYGRHGDIKSDNLLVFLEPQNETSGGHGVIKISDFGLTRVHRRSSITADSAQTSAASLTYRGPECDTNGRMTPAYDIWGLGCLYLEFVTWYLLGATAVEEEFPRTRLLQHEIDSDDPEVVPHDTFYQIIQEKDGQDNNVVRARIKTAVQDVSDFPAKLPYERNCETNENLINSDSGSTYFALMRVALNTFMTSCTS